MNYVSRFIRGESYQFVYEPTNLVFWQIEKKKKLKISAFL